MHIHNLVKKCNLFSRYSGEAKFWRKIRAIYNSVTYVTKMTSNNPYSDLVYDNAFIKFDQNLSICSQDIELKKEILVFFKDHISGTSECKMTTVNVTIPTYILSASMHMLSMVTICQPMQQSQPRSCQHKYIYTIYTIW